MLGFGISVAYAEMLEVVHGLIEQCRHVSVVEPVVHVLALPLTGDEPEVAQHAELMRYRGLLHPDLLGQVADAASPAPEP